MEKLHALDVALRICPIAAEISVPSCTVTGQAVGTKPAQNCDS